MAAIYRGSLKTEDADLEKYSSSKRRFRYYNPYMRRLLAILLLVVSGLPLVPSLMAATQVANGDAHLPACCRRHGAHHCSSIEHSSARPSSEPQAKAPSEKCPLWPAAVSLLSDAGPALHREVSSSLDQLASAKTIFVSQKNFSSTLKSIPQQRGPPTLFS